MRTQRLVMLRGDGVGELHAIGATRFRLAQVRATTTAKFKSSTRSMTNGPRGGWVLVKSAKWSS